VSSGIEIVLNRIESYDNIIFIDESGNEDINNLAKKDVSKFYIVGALVTKSKHVKPLEELFGKVRGGNFHDEMKSCHVGKNLKRRIKILKELFTISGYTIDILIVDKTKLNGGYKYPKSLKGIFIII